MNIRRILTLLIAAALAGSVTFGQAEDVAAPAPGPTPPAKAKTSGGGGSGGIYIVPIRNEITDLTRDFLDRCIIEAEAGGAACIVLDFNTPGGLVSSAIDISTRLKNLDVHTVAWVNTEAISAGSLISLACDEIIVAPRGKIGDCAAIMIGPEGLQSLGKTERAKIDSYILAEFRDSARANGYPLQLCEAMVTLGPAIYRIKNDKANEVRYVRETELHEFNLLAPGHKADDEVGASDWVIDRKVLEADKLLTMLSEEALEFGFAKKQIADETELAAYLGTTVDQVHRFEANWSEQLVAILTSPIVRGLLTILMLMGLYSEMQSPGLGLPGAVALIAAAILFGAPYLAGLASMTELLIVVLGIGLLAVEIFVIPGFGFVGVAGIALVMLGLVMTFVQVEPGPGFMPTLPGSWDMLSEGVITMFVALAISAVGFYFLTKHFGHLPLFRRLVLSDGVSAGAATSASPSSPPTATELGVNVGDRGTVTAMLRPVGRATIGEKLVDVVSDGQWIEPGKAIRVVAVRGNRIVVEEA